MPSEMWTHENMSADFKDGYREGIEDCISTLRKLKEEVLEDRKVDGANWIQVAVDWLEDDHSMYIVGDE